MLFLIVSTLLSCSGKDALKDTYDLSDGNAIDLGQTVQSSESTVLIFLSPECPLCQNYTTTLEALMDKFRGDGVSFYGVLSGDYYTVSEMKGFLIKYDLDLPVILDPKFQLAKKWDATITPEVVLLDKNGENLYQGAIDNWAISLGQKRFKITERYLQDALIARKTGDVIDPKKTNPVGCFIE
jgi:peroxiredoxin